MSWYVENLFRNSTSIREGIMESSNAISILNTESDLYMDLLSVESTFKKLCDQNLVKFFDKRIVEFLSSGLSIEEVAEKVGVARTTIVKKFSTVCSRIAFVLGDNFSDLGYINYMKEKYKLTDEEVDRALEFMKSSSRRVIVN